VLLVRFRMRRESERTGLELADEDRRWLLRSVLQHHPNFRERAGLGKHDPVEDVPVAVSRPSCLPPPFALVPASWPMCRCACHTDHCVSLLLQHWRARGRKGEGGRAWMRVLWAMTLPPFLVLGGRCA